MKKKENLEGPLYSTVTTKRDSQLYLIPFGPLPNTKGQSVVLRGTYGTVTVVRVTSRYDPVNYLLQGRVKVSKETVDIGVGLYPIWIPMCTKRFPVSVNYH